MISVLPASPTPVPKTSTTHLTRSDPPEPALILMIVISILHSHKSAAHHARARVSELPGL